MRAPAHPELDRFDVDLLIELARRERSRRARRKAGATASGGLAAFLAAAGVEAREDFALADGVASFDDYRVAASAQELFSFAAICATDGEETSAFAHAAHALRSRLASLADDDAFASRFTSRFVREHEHDDASSLPGGGDHAQHAAGNALSRHASPHLDHVAGGVGAASHRKHSTEAAPPVAEHGDGHDVAPVQTASAAASVHQAHHAEAPAAGLASDHHAAMAADAATTDEDALAEALAAYLGDGEPAGAAPQGGLSQEGPIVAHNAHGAMLADAPAPEMLTALPAEM